MNDWRALLRSKAVELEEQRKQAEIQGLAKDSAILGLALLALEYDPSKGRLGRVVRNHHSPYLVKLLGENTIIYAEHQGNPIPVNGLVITAVGNITHERDGNKYGSGRIVKGYKSIKLSSG